jgi:transposase
MSSSKAHDNRLVSKLLSRLKSGSMLLADRGYDADWIRELAMKKGAHGPTSRQKAIATIRSASALSLPCPQQGRTVLQPDQAMPPGSDRYDRLAANYLAFVQLASIRLWLAAR